MHTITRLISWSCVLVLVIACTPATPVPSAPHPSDTPQPTAAPAPTARSALRPTDRPPSPAPPTAPPSPSPVPLTSAAMAACPVTLPNGKAPADASAADFNLGNEAGTLYTILWPGGKVIFSPRGPGQKYADGSLEMKWPWYRTIVGDVIITGRRLDADAPPMPPITLRGVPDGYGKTGFHPSGLVFPSVGCWEITATVGAAKLTFVTLAVKLPFDPPWPGWLPDGLLFKDQNITGAPTSIRLIFGARAGGERQVSIETTQGIREHSDSAPLAAQQPVTVRGQPGGCAQGAWDADQHWRATVDAGSLEWTAADFSYRIRQTGLGLRCEDLLRIAESLCFDPTVPCEASLNDSSSGQVEHP